MTSNLLHSQLIIHPVIFVEENACFNRPVDSLQTWRRF